MSATDINDRTREEANAILDGRMYDTAFPQVYRLTYEGGRKTAERFVPGLTKRELFAATAMNGMLTNGCMTECGQRGYAPDTIAKHAVMQADALIEELKKS